MSNRAAETPVASADPRFWVWNGNFDDFDKANEAIRGFGLDWLQIDRGPTELRFQQIGSPNALFSRLSVSRKYHQRGVIPKGTWSFAMIGRTAPDLEWQGNKATTSHIYLYPRDDEYQLVTLPGNHGDVLSVSDACIRSIAERLGFPDPADGLPKGAAFLKVGESRTERLRQTLGKLHSAPDYWISEAGVANERTRFEDDLIADLLECVFAATENTQPLPARPNRSRALRRALEFIIDNADTPPSIAEVCRAGGSSWRTLNYAFREQFGVTPKQYLQAVRLHGVRKQLRRTGEQTSVSKAAADWGFWHLGKFAAEYRIVFGELPSETLTQRLGGSISDQIE